MSEDNFVRITLRLPKELQGSLNEAASKTGRSMNSEIVERLYAVGDVQKNIEARDAVLAEMKEAVEKYQQLYASREDITRRAILLMIDFIADKDKTPERERDMSLALLRFLSSVDKPL